MAWFIAGIQSSSEMELARSYLAEFEIVDEGRILEEDWEHAKRLAARVPRDGKPRQLGDCLIRAIAIRLKCEVRSLDTRFQR
jgi:predicted nucleic acid-binding protein